MIKRKDSSMSNQQPSLTDLASIMRAAEAESKLLANFESTSDGKESNECATIIGQPTAVSSTSNSLPSIPGFNLSEDNKSSPLDMGNVKEALKNTNISTMLNQMAADPDNVAKMMEESMGKMTPEMMEQARKLAMGGQGEQIMKEMQKRGMDPHAMRAQIMEQQRMLRGTGGNTSDATQQVILINKSRQLKIRKISPASLQLSVSGILRAPSPVELSCSRLAQGPLAGKTIKVWYDPEQPGVNRRSKKILGFGVGGDIIIVMMEGNLSEKDFLAAEKRLA
ncbi:Hypothetical protein HVR_LOCUS1086 [uncultured virus]|nr:Hypothetical protein HVR_LOCUS1086 [uncultured virus]